MKKGPSVSGGALAAILNSYRADDPHDAPARACIALKVVTAIFLTAVIMELSMPARYRRGQFKSR